MLGFLVHRPFKELKTLSSSPQQLALRLLCSFIGLLNIPIGLVALIFRAADREVRTLLGEQLSADLVASAKERFGRLQMERLKTLDPKSAECLVQSVLRIWYTRTGKNR